MGDGIASTCPADYGMGGELNEATTADDESSAATTPGWHKEQYEALGLLNAACLEESDDTCDHHLGDNDPAGNFLPLVYQEFNETKILQQPLDFTTLAQKYNDFTMDFLEDHKDNPFFLYMPFSHVHATSHSQPGRQYAGCAHKGSTQRGMFGDALAEADWIVGNVVKKLEDLNLDENTLILFTSDNGPWLVQSMAGGSEGLFTGRSSGYWDTGKGSTWEGGIREPAFAYWKGTIQPFSRSSEIVSSMDVFPTLSKLAGVDLPSDRAFDGRDMSDILLNEAGKSNHDFLFFYGGCHEDSYTSISAVRHGKYKAHWCTAPGLGQWNEKNLTRKYDPPLMFDVEADPSESVPLNAPNESPKKREDLAALNAILKAHAMEVATFTFGKIVPIPDGSNEGPDEYGVCCDRSKGCNCTTLAESVGIFQLGTRVHHDRYHSVLGEEEPAPHRTRAQRLLHQGG
jgi:arylsulfatase A